MSKTNYQQQILAKLNIAQLNPMQEEAQLAIQSCAEVILLSPTGSGKTLAFFLPLIESLDSAVMGIQALILVPSRELAIQIEQVAREMGTGYKINAVYGGRAGSKDKADLKHLPAILIGTPGRVADHLRRRRFGTDTIHTLVLDEFDKSLEVGFEEEMKEIIHALPQLQKKVLTSATQEVAIPSFVGLKNPISVDYLDEGISQLQVKTILSPTKDKLETLVKTLHHIGPQPGIIFCNFKATIERVSDFLHLNKIEHGCFYGGMEQQDRERALIKFRNGTHQLIIATDLAARGIDIPEIKFILHYHLPQKATEFTHRNGRTARMSREGTAYVLLWEEENLPDFIQSTSPEIHRVDDLPLSALPASSEWQTLFISGGRRDKISKGDIAGLFFKQGQLRQDQLGTIELKQDCAFAAVHATKVKHLIQMIDNSKLKNKKIRISII